MGTLDLSPRDVLKRELSDPASPASAALSATYVPKWKANTAYTAGDAVLSPAGDTVTAVANFTSGASFNAANWNISSSYDRAGQAAALSIVFGG